MNFATAGGFFGTFTGVRTQIEGAMEQFLTGKVATAKEALDAVAKTENEKLTEYNSTVK